VRLESKIEGRETDLAHVVNVIAPVIRKNDAMTDVPILTLYRELDVRYPMRGFCCYGASRRTGSGRYASMSASARSIAMSVFSIGISFLRSPWHCASLPMMISTKYASSTFHKHRIISDDTANENFPPSISKMNGSAARWGHFSVTMRVRDCRM
jgi:hypothetical protein